MARGIIASPAAYIGNGSMLRTERGITALELRYFLLYWDKVVIPTNNLVHVSIPFEEEFLSTGVVERPRVAFGGTFNGEAIAKAQSFAQSKIARELIENDKETDWVIHQIGDRFNFENQDISEKQVIRVELVNVLPVPNDDIPISEILEFKERRKDELSHLHSAIDDLYLEILSSSDRELKSKKAVSELSKAVSSLETVSNEKWKKATKFDFSAELNINGRDLFAGAVAGLAYDKFLNSFDFPIAFLLGAAVSAIKISAKKSMTFESSKSKSIYGYLAQAHREGVLNKKL